LLRFGEAAERSKALAGKVIDTLKGVRGFDKIVYGEVAERSKAHAWKVCNT
jgi:hypothetical protein